LNGGGGGGGGGHQVGITASCSVVEPYAAALIGVGAGVVYTAASRLLKHG